MRRFGSIFLILVVMAPAVGCGTGYRTTAAAADFSMLSSDGHTWTAQVTPLAELPARIALAHLQAENRWSQQNRRWDRGYGLVGNHEAASAEDLERVAKLALVEDVVVLNRFAFTDGVASMDDVRAAAARVQADMLLVYTYDTIIDDRITVPAVGLLTLGIFPNIEVSGSTVVSAALIDVRSGFVFGLVEGREKQERIASAWTTMQAKHNTTERVERIALSDALDNFETLWKQVLARTDSKGWAPPTGSKVTHNMDGWTPVPAGGVYSTRDP